MLQILKKYGIIILITIILFIFLQALMLKTNQLTTNLNIFLQFVICLMSGFIVRAADDIFDYEKDQANNKKTIPYSISIIILLFSFITMLLMFFIIDKTLLTLILGIFFFSFILYLNIYNKKRIKIFILPFILIMIILTNVYLYQYTINIYLFIYLIISIGITYLFFLQKEAKK